MVDYKERVAQDAQLTILKELATENSFSLNESILRDVLDTFGINRDREWIRAQLKQLASLDAITVRMAGSVMIAVLTQSGLDHVNRRTAIDGIKKPSPE